MDLSERDAATARRHPWEVARSRFFRRLIARHVDLGSVTSVLDVGAGDGWFTEELAQDVPASCQLVCWDVNYTADDLAAEAPTGGPLDPRVRRVTEAPVGTFDLVLLLDVIEHIADDDGFVRELVVPRLHEQSVVVVSVPAYERLFSAHDTSLGHERRYRPRRLHGLLGRHLEIVERGGLFTTLLAPRLVAVGAERLGAVREQEGIGHWRGGEGLTSTLTAALDADASAGYWLSRHGVRVPGLSTWAVCRRRSAR